MNANLKKAIIGLIHNLSVKSYNRTRVNDAIDKIVESSGEDIKGQIENITENIEVTDLKFNGWSIEDPPRDYPYGVPFVKMQADYADYSKGTPLKVGSKITIDNFQDDYFYGFCGIELQIIITGTNKINKFIGLGFFQHTIYGKTGEETWTLDLPNCQRLILNFIKDIPIDSYLASYMKASKQFEVTAIEDFQFVEVVQS